MTKAHIVHDLNALGIVKGDRVLVHMSYKSLGGVEGGIPTVIEALKEAVGEEGTLLFPAFTYDRVNRDNPVFDVKSTPCFHIGMTAEVFRHSDGVKRSVHPTHSVSVWGRDRDWFVADHHLDPICVGERSPIARLKDVGGKILMIGCGITHNTLIHGVEAYLPAPYVFQKDYHDPQWHREYTCIDHDDRVHRAEFFHEFAEAHGYLQDFGKLDRLMDIPCGYVLQAESFVMDAKTVWDTVLGKMQEDPYFFVSKKEE